MADLNLVAGNKFLLMFTPKAANSAMKTAIREWAGGSTDPNKLHGGWKRVPLFEIPSSPLFKVACVRNPYDRLVSCWQQKLWEGGQSGITDIKGFYARMPFDEFIDRVCELPSEEHNIHFRPMHLHIPCWDYLIKFETLEQDWENMMKWFGLPKLKLINSSTHRPWREYYSIQTALKVAEKFAKDLEMFGYGDSGVKK